MDSSKSIYLKSLKELKKIMWIDKIHLWKALVQITNISSPKRTNKRPVSSLPSINWKISEEFPDEEKVQVWVNKIHLKQIPETKIKIYHIYSNPAI